MGLDLGLREGKSAQQISRDIRQYLHEPNVLFRRVRDTHGSLHLSKQAQKMGVGRGVYRSSYKNAMRVARTEVNMAYRASDMERYRGLDFVVGYEVRRSNHIFGCPVCEALKGKYPKDFTFLGWHPQCRCHTIPILEGGKITDVPGNFKEWLNDNQERMQNAKSVPYWIRENKHFIDEKHKKRYKEYQKLNADKNYTDVAFDKKTAGVKATHRLHNFDPNRGHYEKEVRDILFKNGDKIVLAKEIAEVGEIIKDGQKHIDGHLNGLSFDVSTILGEGKNTIKKAFQHSYKKNAEVAILYFPDKNIYSKERIFTGLKMFRGSNKYEFAEIILIVNGKVEKL